jgi:hypothetical protein
VRNLRFDLAQPSDDAELRRLLRETPMEGRIRIALTREPDCFLAATIEGGIHQVIVARDRASDRLLGMGSRSVSDAWINGVRARLGYLSQLRVHPTARGRPTTIKTGYAKLKELHRDGATPFYVTTIIEDNLPARRLLEAGIQGLPIYRPLSSLVTLVLPVTGKRRAASGPSASRCGPGDLEEIVECLQRYGARYQFAPHWTRDGLVSPERTRGLRTEDFYGARSAGRLVGCLARWDQRAFKQSVVVGYDRTLGLLRPWINLAGPLLRTPRLPPPGEKIRSAFVSHLAVDEDDPEVLLTLLTKAYNDAARDGLDYLMLGLTERHPLLPVVRKRFRFREYVSIIYVVHWEDGSSAVDALDDRVPHLEVAVL